jgi:3-oxoacyl-(acyl-carrier-protein) synthase/acyl carrier protein
MDIAIIGQACNLPGAPDLTAFAQLLESGCDAITGSGLGADGMPIVHSEDSNSVPERWIDAAGYAQDFYQFDYKLFGISLRDSLIIEPQQRLFLQHCWKALENAGYNPVAPGCSVGVYSTSSDSHYQADIISSTLNLKSYDPFELEIGCNKEQQSTRVSYLFNLNGPSCGVQSACSSGLMTLHVAMQALNSGDCEMALAGGSCLPFPLHVGYHYREGMNWSATGKIRSFDQDADGMIAGFGCVVFALKTRERALADGDTVYALIKGSSINNDGHVKSTYTAPSSKAVSANIQQLLAKTGCQPNDIGFVEAHGSGTKIGDVIEASALARVFAGEPEDTLPVGSIKSVIGHLDTVAGLAGLLKAIIQLNANTVYPAVNFNRLNEKISFKNTSLKVSNQRSGLTKNIGLVNSLGIGGTNCALLVAAPPQQRSTPNDLQHEPLDVYVGAQTEERLASFIAQLAKELAQTSYQFVDVVFTLNQRAIAKHCITSFKASSLDELIMQLEQYGERNNLGNADISNQFTYTEPEASPVKGRRIALASSELDSKCEVKLEYPDKPAAAGHSHTATHTASGKTLGVEDQLRKIWLDNLMLDDVNETTSFLAEGGHSILALSFVDDIKKYFGLQLDMDWIDQRDTFAEQFAYITEALKGKEEKSYIKLLKKSDGEPEAILLLVHASISGYESYKNLAEPISNSIYSLAVDSHNLYAEESEIIADIDELTDIYVESIRRYLREQLPPAWQSAPLVLGGWSLGGKYTQP